MLFKRKQLVLKDDFLQEKIDSLRRLYMPMDLNPINYRSKTSAVKKLDYILRHTTRKNLQEANFTDLLVCALTMVYFFGMRIKLSGAMSRYSSWFSKRDFVKAELAFQKTMDMLEPERSDITIKITLNFFTDVSLWPYESFVCEILEVVLYFNRGSINLFNTMLTEIHYVLFSDVKTARHRMRVMYELLKSENWIIDKQKLLPFITRLLDFFAKGASRVSFYKQLSKGFEVCLRRIFERAGNQNRLTIIATMLNWFALTEMDDDDVLEFFSLVERAAELYKVRSYNDSFKNGLINHVVINLVGSSNPLHSLLGCRLLQRFLDRQGNVNCLVTPTIFYEFTEVKLVVGTFDSGDKSFISDHRDKFHKYILNACKNHCNSSVNLKAIFFVICCLVLEVPCGLTAATAAYIVMSIQDFALNGENISLTCRCWMHAIVVSIMSLICWVHKSPVLYSYVNHIISRRAKEAPQLNPPLMQTYTVMGHHNVTWNKPSLFFEDWELRYGLWKHFVDQQQTLKKSERSKKKIPFLKIDF